MYDNKCLQCCWCTFYLVTCGFCYCFQKCFRKCCKKFSRKYCKKCFQKGIHVSDVDSEEELREYFADIYEIDREFQVLLERVIDGISNVQNKKLLQNTTLIIYHKNDAYKIISGKGEHFLIANYERSGPVLIGENFPEDIRFTQPVSYTTP